MRENPQKLVVSAMFVAIIVLLGVTPLGLIPLGFINVTILCVPVIVGTILLGLHAGMLLGACFGLCSVMSMMGLTMTPPSGLASALLGQSPPLAIIMCLAPRLMVPVVTWCVYRLVARHEELSVKALPFAAIAGSLTNTVLYLGMMLLFYHMTALDNAKLLTVIGGTGLIGGGSEAVAAAVITSPVVFAIWKAQHKI